MGGRSALGWSVCRSAPYFHCLLVLGMRRSRREGNAGSSGTIECCSPPPPPTPTTHLPVYPSSRLPPTAATSLLPRPLGEPLLRCAALLAVVFNSLFSFFFLIYKKASSATLLLFLLLFCLLLVYLFCFAFFVPLWSARFRLAKTETNRQTEKEEQAYQYIITNKINVQQ